MTITLSSETAALARRRAQSLSFANLEQSIAALVAEEARDQDHAVPEHLKVRSAEDLRAKIQQGPDSGPATIMTPDDWADLRQRVTDRIAAAPSRTKAS